MKRSTVAFILMNKINWSFDKPRNNESYLALSRKRFLLASRNFVADQTWSSLTTRRVSSKYYMIHFSIQLRMIEG